MPRQPTAAVVRRTVREVIALETRALEALGRSVDGSWARAVSMLSACRGKVVVTGIGKSGLIAQKIAATFSSTGTPALYLHAAEGAHGDLGLVGPRDLVLALGKSGESAELTALLPAFHRLGTKLIALTANPESTLARGADVVLLTPIEREACPLNLAPTCSTTSALAAGDALAVALMRLRGFRREHFALLHPGGSLGRRLTLRVRDVMRGGAGNPLVAPDAPMLDVLVKITKMQAGAASVADRRGRLVGLVTDFDVRRALERGADIRSLRARDVMNGRPITIPVDSLAVDAAATMSDRRRALNVLPVVDARGRAVGMIQIHDLRARGL